jgi:hypothetical protein
LSLYFRSLNTMQELTLTEMPHVNGAGGGVRVGSDGANNLVGGTAAQSFGGAFDQGAVQALGGRVDPGGANNAF